MRSTLPFDDAVIADPVLQCRRRRRRRRGRADRHAAGARWRPTNAPRSWTGRPRLLAERLEDIAADLAREAAKPIKQARVEVQRAVSTLQFVLPKPAPFAGDLIPMDAAAAGGSPRFSLRVPIGVVGAITPFNFPLNLVAHKIGLIAAGCAVVNKPASQTPLSALALAKVLFEEAGLPMEYLSVVPGPGSVIGDALVRNDDVEVISFTGSPEVGWSIRRQRPRANGSAWNWATTPR